MLEMKVKYHNENSKPIQQAHQGEWFDLRLADEVKLMKDDWMLASLGVSIQLPEGYEAIMVPRSSSYKSHHVIQTNHMGVIDEKYCGPNDIWRIPLYALRDTVIPAGTRIAQFRIQKIQPEIQVIEVDEMTAEDRGGIGSTGTN